MEKIVKAAKDEKEQTNRLFRFVLKLQSNLADYLNKKTADWSPARLKLLLVIFCLTAGNISLYIISQAISAPGKPLIQRARSTIRSPVLNHPDSLQINIHKPTNTISNEQSNTK